jgi:excisionase family DNA binding protein
VVSKNAIAPGWITTQEAAELADYTPTRIRQLAKNGRVEARKVARIWLINKESLLQYKAQVRPGRPRQRDDQSSSRVYTVEEAAEILKVSPQVVYQWVRDGELKASRLGSAGRMIRISESNLMDFLERASQQE